MRIHVDMTSVGAVFIAQNWFCAENGGSHPSVAPFYRIVFTLDSIPSSCILVCLSESNSTESKPQEESHNGEPMDWWNQKIVVQEESIKEMQIQKVLNHD